MRTHNLFRLDAHAVTLWPRSQRTYTEQEADMVRTSWVQKWVFEAKNGTQRAQIQKTHCKICAMHHGTSAQCFSTSDYIICSYGGSHPSTAPQCPRSLAGERHKVRVQPSNVMGYSHCQQHGCTFPAVFQHRVLQVSTVMSLFRATVSVSSIFG